MPKGRQLVSKSGRNNQRLRERRDILLHPAVKHVVDGPAVGAGTKFFLPGECSLQCESMGVTLGNLRLKRVIPTVAERSPAHVDASELRIRPQRLRQGQAGWKARIRDLEPGRLGPAGIKCGSQQRLSNWVGDIQAQSREPCRRYRIQID